MDKRKSTAGRTDPSRPAEGASAAAPGTTGATAAGVTTAGTTTAGARAAGATDTTATYASPGPEPQRTGGPNGGGTKRGIVEAVQRKTTEQLTSQKGRATDGLDALASAVRQTSSQLRQERHDGVAQYIDRAADGIERFSGTLKSKDATELLQDAQRFARRQPALFIGGSFALGLLAARFLKSSPRGASTSMHYDRETY
jgi:hypothetical protein